MEYRNLGQTGLQVSTLCLGTMTFGEPDPKSFMHGVGSDEATSFGVMDRAVEHGINFFDTADVYGQDGLTERVIGKWLARSKQRERIVLASKFRFRMQDGPNGSGASRLRILRCVEDSLRRLQTDRLDLYQIHMQDNDTPEEETLRALDDLIRQGKVLYIGASNYAAYRLVDSLWESRTRNLSPFVALQAQYSLVSRHLEREHIPACLRHGLGVLPYSPLASGFLSGKYTPDGERPAGSRLAKWQDRYGTLATPRNWDILAALRGVAKEVGATSAVVALAWLLHKPAVTSVIFGARNAAQLDDNVAAAKLKLPADVMSKLDAVSAPELFYPYEFLKRVQGRW
jgi:aryl-alcohol dehydrogenase-like predicted oxidoreductase